MPALGGYQYTQGVVDQSNENSSYSFYIPSGLDILNATYPATIAAMNAAVSGLCDGTPTSEVETITRRGAPVPFGSGTGNREDKWLVEYHDLTTLKKYSFTLPCRRPTDGTVIKLIPGTDYLDPTLTVWTDLETAMGGGNVLSPEGGHVSLDAIRLVGRNI